MRVGVVGTGVMGENHVRNYVQMGCELVGVYDNNPMQASKVAAKYGAVSFGDLGRFLDSVDTVSLCSPTTTHCDLARRILAAGKHLLIEKPIASTADEADAIMVDAVKAGTVVAVGHLERFNPGVVALKGVIDEGKLGDVVSITTRRVGPLTPQTRDVSVILDLGVHDIDIVSMLFGASVEEVFAVGGSLDRHFEDHASLALRYPGNRVGLLDVNWLTPRKIRKLIAVGTRAVAELDYAAQTLTIIDEGEDREIPVQHAEPLRCELLAFLTAIETGQRSPNLASLTDGTFALTVALAAVDAVRQGRSIALHPTLL
jgi:UDP-N-acetylglucosamine 3-dehydrogenase